MAEILLEPSSLSKIIPLSFDLNDTNASNAAQLMTKRQFNTADTDAWFQISLEGFVDTAGSFDITLFNLNDKSVFNHTGKPFATNPFYYKLDSGSDETTNEIRHAGRWIGQIVVTLANGDSATRKFIFDIEGHILDGQDAQVILLSDYQALINTINLSKDDLAQYNVDYAALLVDIAAAEDARVTAYNQLLADQLSATNQPIVDTGNYFNADNTNAALQELGAHKASTSNPHGVTKVQVGLGNVDNTSDANKPVSTAQQTALNLKANKVQEAWITPTLVNAWVAGTFAPAYMKDEMGFVHLKGQVKSGTTYAFILPIGYRPLQTTRIPINANGLFGFANIQSGGEVYITGNNADVYLDGVNFKAER